MGQAHLGVLDLPVTGLTAQVVANLPNVCDAGRRDRMTLGLEATGNVDRRRTVTPGGARVEKKSAAPPSSHSIRLS